MLLVQRDNPIQTLTRSVPISLSHSEFAFGLRMGVAMISRPRCSSEVSNPAEKIASRSWVMKR
jgi:hypothetical protein